MAKWYTIVPILQFYNKKSATIPDSFDLGCDVHFRPIPEWLREPQIIKHLSQVQRENITKETQYVLVREYEANSLGEPDPDWLGKTARSKQKSALEKIQISNLALWLVKPSLLGFGLVFHIEERQSSRATRESFLAPRLIPHKRDENNFHETEDFELARKVNLALEGLPQRDNSIWMSARTLWEALRSRAWEVRFVLLWIVLEALFGTHIEIAYRISTRIAFFLSPSDRIKASELYKAVKTSYNWRSKVIHGMQLYKLPQERSEEVLYNTEDFARRALIKILSDPQLIKIFSSNKEREKYLDNLAFLV